MNTEPLDQAFNVAVRAMAARLCPRGYDVGPEAPDTFEALVRHVNATGRVLVWNGASEGTIFADPETNYAFRAWHDCSHIIGGFDFTLTGEIKTAALQRQHLRTIYGDGPAAARFGRLVDCEVIGQAEHYLATGSFPTDQRAFAQAYLERA